MGAELVIDRAAENFRFWAGEHSPATSEWKRFGQAIRELTGGQDPDIVLEHPGRETFATSVFVARRGGTIVTCASTSGYQHYYDNRYLWMSVKRIIGSHFANYAEASAANRLIARGIIHPTLSQTFPLDQVGQATHDIYHNRHEGKIGILCLAPRAGMGVRDQELRNRRIGEINRFRKADADEADLAGG